MRNPPFQVSLDLGGWALLWVRLELDAAGGGPGASGVSAVPAVPTAPAGPPDPLADLRRQVVARARSRHDLGRLPEHATVAAVRALFRAAGCDPTRYRPSSEALLRRVLKGEDLPAIQPLVDLNNCLSLELATPCGIAAEGSFTPPITLRSGRPGETFQSLRGPFNLEGKPLLADAAGPFGTPISDSQRTSVEPGTRRAWFVAYLPAAVLVPEIALDLLQALLSGLPIAPLDVAASLPSGGPEA
jgi:DNA/RNA-binding domain of Phe-tRNA-synthetase-like protein